MYNLYSINKYYIDILYMKKILYTPMYLINKLYVYCIIYINIISDDFVFRLSLIIIIYQMIISKLEFICK